MLPACRDAARGQCERSAARPVSDHDDQDIKVLLVALVLEAEHAQAGLVRREEHVPSLIDELGALPFAFGRGSGRITILAEVLAE